MSVASITAAGRRATTTRYAETLTFFRVVKGGIPEGQIDPVDTETTLYSDVPGQVKFHTVQVSDQEQAGQLLAVQQVMVKVAVGSTPDVRPDHFCRVTASTVDPSLVGREFRVSGMPQAGQVTSHRYPVEEAS